MYRRSAGRRVAEYPPRRLVPVRWRAPPNQRVHTAACRYDTAEARTSCCRRARDLQSRGFERRHENCANHAATCSQLQRDKTAQHFALTSFSVGQIKSLQITNHYVKTFKYLAQISNQI